MSELTLAKAVDEVGVFRVDFIRKNCRDESDAIALAVAFMTEARVIFVAMSGKNSAAMQFYSVADGLAASE